MTAAQASNSQHRVRYAVFGLGWFAQSAALPTKLAEISQQYSGVQRTFSYAEYGDCLSSGLI